MKGIGNSGALVFNDFDVQADTIILEPSHIDRAIELSDPIQNEQQQWQAYLNALALFAFEQWLNECAPELDIEREKCSINYPQYAGLLDAVCNFSVGKFKVCLLAMGTSIDDAIDLPRVAVELPQYSAHFYVVLSVIEELDTAKIQGFIHHERLIENLNSSNLTPNKNWNFRIPVFWFDSNYENLLLSLRCLDVPINNEAQVTTSPELLSKIRAKIEQYLPQLQADKRKWWEVFKWEEARVLFTHPELFQPANSFVNVAVWLQDKLDIVAQELAWVLLPSFNLSRFRFQAATAMRSPIEELDDILTQLERSGRDIPRQARGAYQNLKLDDIPLRLYVVTWSLLSPENIPLWKLLLVLGVPEGKSLPHGTTLRVSDSTDILLERVRDRNTDAPYLYALVAGTWEDIFSVTITLINGATVTLPPFAFHN